MVSLATSSEVNSDADWPVDIVVVYKIDRLSRSLMDFAKLVEVFDRHDVTFVSVTQSFNTTTSMGRLTLNILLSFAQFEREVRSRIAARVKVELPGCPSQTLEPPAYRDLKERFAGWEQAGVDFAVPMDGRQVPVILDDCIMEFESSDNGAIPVGCYSSDIYFVPFNADMSCPANSTHGQEILL